MDRVPDHEVVESPTPVGLVLGTDDATPLSFWVALAPGQVLQLDDVVVTARTLPDGGRVVISGIVNQVRARLEGARFDSDVFLVSDGVLPAEVSEAAEVLATRVAPEFYVPPLPGTPVLRATGTARDEALYFDQMAKKLPLGLGRDGQPVFLDLEFLDGTRGAHVNISGISGVATKTSYACFLLHALFSSGVLGAEARNTKALIFNVKGEDLLFLDRPNTQLADEHREVYGLLGLPAAPFASVGFFAPPRPADPAAGPNVATRKDGAVRSFFWTLQEFCTEELLPFVFADAEDDRQQFSIIIGNVTARLRDAVPISDAGAVRLDGVDCRSYAELVDLIIERVSDDLTRPQWAGPAMVSGSVGAFIRRLAASVRPLRPLVRGDIDRPAGHRVNTEGQQVTVVDLHALPDRAKRFVVGVTLRREFDRKEATGQPRPELFVVLDELNKYAPRDGSSPIKEILLDMAERGRSLGIILVGAQQTASEVERRVVGQSAVKIVGRLDPAEATRSEYDFLPAATRKRATIAKPGTMFVSQPQLPVPLVIEFPFPAWATRPAEAEAPPPPVLPDGRPAVPSDPFSVLPS
jgi:DNA helicase HerA-like ATPase